MSHPHPLDRLLAAARARAWTEVDAILAKGILINKFHPKTQTPIIAMLATENLPSSCVYGLIERGGSRRWALYGAAQRREPHLMNELLTDQDADLEFAVKGAAFSGNLELVEKLFARAGKFKVRIKLSNNAVEGAAMGRHSDLVTLFLDQGASASKAVYGAAHVGDSVAIEQLFTKFPTVEMRFFIVTGAALGGHSQLVNQYLEGDNILDALQSAAIGDHKVLVDDLFLKLTPIQAAIGRVFCIRGGATGGHYALIHPYLETSHDMMVAIDGFIQGEHVGFGFLDHLITRCYANIDGVEVMLPLVRDAATDRHFKTKRMASDFMTNIINPEYRRMLAREQEHDSLTDDPDINLESLLQGTHMPMTQHNVSFRAALMWEQHRKVLPMLLTGKGNFAKIPPGVREIIARHYVGVQRINQPDMHQLNIAIKQAYEGAGDRAIDRKVREAWFETIRIRLRHCFGGRKKANALLDDDTLKNQTNALCRHRWQLQKCDAFLPLSMRETMEKFPEFRNALALRHWLENCARYLSNRFDTNQSRLGHRLFDVIWKLKEFPVEECNVHHLAKLLKTQTENVKLSTSDSIEKLLSNQPFWPDLLTLFPGLEEALVEENRQVNEMMYKL